MSPGLSDREWQAFMGTALGLCVSEEGLLMGTDEQRDTCHTVLQTVAGHVHVYADKR
ncbi:hypothetical protein [Streptomyces sp. NPDC048442]|uniref:hypothetical protein n=1 Tax=Streptomyces sp. NPDC048442 TaxID=3154823 RepID=UPI003447B869